MDPRPTVRRKSLIVGACAASRGRGAGHLQRRLSAIFARRPGTYDKNRAHIAADDTRLSRASVIATEVAFAIESGAQPILTAPLIRQNDDP